MLKFLKNLIRPEEPEQLLIGFTGIPGWLSERRTESVATLDTGTKKERNEIRSSVEQLAQVIQILTAARFNEDIHPRLRSIAEKSLPQYTKAINGALEKPLPEEPPEFYTAAAELLKACINSSRGQGKYLQAAFPDEMKAITACIASIGRNINAMNGPVGTYRKRIARIDEAAKVHGALTDIDQDYAKSQEKEERMQRHIGKLNEQAAACEQTARALDQERTGQDLAGQERGLSLLKGECDQTMHRYSALSMTASHVLRKAEKVAHRQQKGGEGKAIAAAMSILSNHKVPDPSELPAALSAAYKPARRMIDAGEVVLKNREERELFSSEQEFLDRIMAPCTRYAQEHERYVAAERTFASHPVITRHAEVKRELKLLYETLAKDRQAHADLLQWQQELKGNIPGLKEQIRKIMGEIAGGDVQISYPEGTPLSP